MNSQTNLRKRFYIHTLGCKVNQYESQAMREILLRAGFKECIAKEIADIYIINTCTVTHHADRESRYLVGMFHRINPGAKIVVTGCYVEKNADEISFLPGVAHIVKNEEKGRIADILDPQPAASIPQGSFDAPLTITGFKDRTKAFVKIQDGCENRCSYCKVPLVRGALKSKPLEKVVEEASLLAASGFKELVLVGICLGAWGRDFFPSEAAASVGLKEISLIDLLKALDAVPGDFRIRLSSIEPKYVTDELIEFIAKSKNICRHLHIPLQSGDDEILRRMNRPYTTTEYRELIGKLRLAMEDIAISTDVMVGFPGETDANFSNTVNFLKSIVPARTHIFRYSRRDGTAAGSMSGEIGEETAKKRYYDLKTVALMAAYIYKEKFINKPLEVLVESKRDRQSGLLTGYSDNYIRILFNGPDAAMKNMAAVKIEELTMGHALGRLCKDDRFAEIA
ncbi:MAG: tRNA (N(6)-L-threonylcarbamoyladenosine(37)-C(2))-methylthiotransferase MtaB [Candidatus Omnitrophica bacterium]|nr:tRNA (N(6)-L-threonylcarbamoyladenosine(37)-C(2))-methylthiotransferase MtaB [Candidatus Omnitrophota bacterium]MDD5436022.1 tRNA (N(6)-L-threonylcarbamoyladenosine(37)-C(2))-methylthiotransferase MtaB [Candidatus Omnitrophota bacterium]